MTQKRRAIEAKLNKAFPASETLAHLKVYNDECAEWYGVCLTCGTKAHGTLTQLRQPCVECGAGWCRG